MGVAVYGSGYLAETIRCLGLAHFEAVAILAPDTPLREDGAADLETLTAELDAYRPKLGRGHVLLMAQVPVGFTRSLATRWVRPIAYVPENIRQGHGPEDFAHQSRVVIGTDDGEVWPWLGALYGQVTDQIMWTTLETAEMSKHALNSYLGMMTAWANEVARLAQAVGADPEVIEAALRSEPRVSDRAPIHPGAPFGLGHLERDIRYLEAIADAQGDQAPLLRAILPSNTYHAGT